MTRTSVAPLSSNDPVVYDVLLNYSKIHLNQNERNELENAVSKITNHHLFVERGLACHLGPLFHKVLGSIDHSLPPNVTSVFASAYHQVLMRNIRMYEVFKAVLKDLNEANIDCLPLKGVYLAESVYQDIGLRHLSDIDILVRESDAEAVCEIMKLKGWEVKVPELRSDIELDQFSPAHPFSFVKKGIVIELHIRLFNLNQGLKLSEAALWNHTHAEPFCHGRIRQLNSEMLLIYLCMHLHKHLLGRECKIASFVDIRELIFQCNDRFDWVVFETRCEEYHCLKEVTEVLNLCRNYWSIEIPFRMLESVTAVPMVEMRFRRFMTGEAYAQAPKAENAMTKSLTNLSSLKDYSAKSRYLVGYIFPKPSFMYRHFQLKEGSFLLPWYVLRVLILSGKLILAMLNRFRNLFGRH